MSEKRPVRTQLSPLNMLRRGVPKKFQKYTIEDFDDYEDDHLIEVKTFLKEYIDNIDERFESNVGLFLFGSNGVGKTLIASIIVKEAYRHRYSSKRMTFVEYVTEYTRIWGTKIQEEKEALEERFYHECKAVEFLVLEEMGKEVDSKISAPILEDCLRYREEKGLVTILCSNLEIKTLVEKYGNSIGSLIKGNLTPIKIIGVDKRKSYYDKKVTT